MANVLCSYSKTEEVMVTRRGVKMAFHVGCSVGGQAVSGLAVAHKGNEA